PRGHRRRWPVVVGRRRHRPWLMRLGARAGLHARRHRARGHRIARIRICLWRNIRKLVGRQDVPAVLDRSTRGNRRPAPRIVADRDITARVTAELNGRRTLAWELLARVVPSTAYGTRIILRHFAIHVFWKLTYSLIGGRPDELRWQEASRARRRITQRQVEVELAARVVRHAAGKRDQRSEQCGEDDQRLFNGLVVNHAHTAKLGQARGENRE